MVSKEQSSVLRGRVDKCSCKIRKGDGRGFERAGPTLGIGALVTADSALVILGYYPRYKRWHSESHLKPMMRKACQIRGQPWRYNAIRRPDCLCDGGHTDFGLAQRVNGPSAIDQGTRYRKRSSLESLLAARHPIQFHTTYHGLINNNSK
jgi:hypothetical protein